MHLRCIAVFLLITFSCLVAKAQAPETRNVILVTLDGLRWQEVFQGLDADIAHNEKYVQSAAFIEEFDRDADDAPRQHLMPFLWNVVAKQGQLYGNRKLKNRVNCKNDHLISYPGYSEMLVGFDGKVSSNRKVDNPHATVFEFIEAHPAFRDEVAIFATWDAFPYIFRESTSALHVNAGKDIAHGTISRQEKLLNEMLQTQPRSDSITFRYAMEYLKRERPRVLFIGFDETDHYAHKGRYDQYLHAAHRADQMIGRLWDWVQAQPDYRDQTTLLITTDHGRGNGKNNWRKHRLLATGSRHIWFAVIGPDTPAFGVMKVKATTYQNQVAKTLAAFLGLSYKNEKPVGDVVQTMISVPLPVKETASTAQVGLPGRRESR